MTGEGGDSRIDTGPAPAPAAGGGGWLIVRGRERLSPGDCKTTQSPIVTSITSNSGSSSHHQPGTDTTSYTTTTVILQVLLQLLRLF